jgi:hypothetical protein
MTVPTDGNDHPDLTGVAGEMRAEWRAEQDAATADAAAQWRHGRGLSDWLLDRMHAGDRIAARVGDHTFAGLVDEVGDDLLALRCTFGRVEINLGCTAPISFALVEHATKGGMRGTARRGFRDALLARDAQPAVSVGTVQHPDGIAGSLFVSRDYVTVVANDVETIIPIAYVVWVAPERI